MRLLIARTELSSSPALEEPPLRVNIVTGTWWSEGYSDHPYLDWAEFRMGEKSTGQLAGVSGFVRVF